MTGYVMVLNTHGWLGWPEAVELLDGCGGTWLGPSGLVTVQGTWPEEQPTTARIHAWSRSGPEVTWRLVPDGSRGVLVTCLTQPGAMSGLDGRPMTVAWSDDGAWRRGRITGVSPVQFLRPADPQPES